MKKRPISVKKPFLPYYVRNRNKKSTLIPDAAKKGHRELQKWVDRAKLSTSLIAAVILDDMTVSKR